jgi:hypothetical protein
MTAPRRVSPAVALARERAFAPPVLFPFPLTGQPAPGPFSAGPKAAAGPDQAAKAAFLEEAFGLSLDRSAALALRPGLPRLWTTPRKGRAVRPETQAKENEHD